MKLAFCLFKYFPYGGLQRDFLRIARICQQRGHEVHVFTMSWQGEREPGFHIHELPTRGLQNHKRIASYQCQLKQALAAVKPDLVIGFNKMPGLDIYYAADVCYQMRMQQRRWWHRVLPRYRFYHEQERAVFAPGQKTELLMISPFQQAAFQQCYNTESDRFHLLPPGIARDRVAPANAGEIRQQMRDAIGLKDSDKLMLLLGSGFKTKGLDRAIRALSALPPRTRHRTLLYVIGQDNPGTYLKLAKQLGVGEQIRFLGGRDDVPDWLLAADLLIHPAYHENTGTVLLEALVAGLPVLTVDHCGYAHYIEEAEAGQVLTSPFQQQALDAVLLNILTKVDLSQWRKNAMQFAKEADIYSLPEKAADLIETIAQKKQAALFDRMMQLTGTVFRKQKGRVTQRVEVGGSFYFLKRQHATGWKEIFKNFCQFRAPVLSMKNEWEAIERLQSLGIKVPGVAAKGERGDNPAARESFVLLEEIAPAISLEELGKHWETNKPDFQFKTALIKQVADISRCMHLGGVNHRDYYICHLLLKTNKKPTELTVTDIDLYLIDLHRAQLRDKVPLRWQIKDLAGLYFSSLDAGLTQQDFYRFIKYYSGKSLRELMPADWQLWQKVKERGDKLYREHHES